MSQALNKSALKQQRDQLALFRKFLPSLDLKRQQLLGALKAARIELDQVQGEWEEAQRRLEDLYPLLGNDSLASYNLTELVTIERVEIKTENLAGVRLPRLIGVQAKIADYSMMATPHWVDDFVRSLSTMATLKLRLRICQVRVERLEAASRRITQRVNLFDKVLIPKAESQIKRIQIFLSDQERSAVVRSKIAKRKE